MFSRIETAGRAKAEFGDEQKKQVMMMFLDTWDEACAQGISSELLSEVCLYLALTDLVEDYGEDDVAEIVESLPFRIRQGEFSLKQEKH